MRVYEKHLLDKRLKDFMEEVLPLDLLPYLSCLQKTDKEAVEAAQNNNGATRAVYILVDRLKRRDKGFPQFVLALRKCGSAHTALLLDPYGHVEDTEDETAVAEDESELGFKRIGTVIDVRISGNLLPEHGEEQSDNCREVEKYVAETYEAPLSENSKRMRKELQQHLPIGAVFVHTEKGSIISTFRLSSASAANEFWAMYKEGKLQLMLQTELVDRTLQENEKTPEEQLTLKVNLGEEKFKKIQKTLADIESDQEIKESGSWLSSPIRKEGETADEDESALEIEIDIPPVFLENGNPLGSPELVLRDYQQELAHPALQGKNTIICAPTNSGKTYVAIEIAKNHLESFSKNQDTCGPPDTRKEPRVVFIVSTVNLVLQQKERFELFLGDKYSVSEISGANATEIPLKYLLQSHKVVIMTAQILVNALNAPDREQRVQLNDMSLLIFDECHHAHKEHSYNRVMEKYLALKMQPGKEHRLPQIVGLTASLGTGKAKTAQKAEEHIILVCANLDAEVVSTVRNHQSELEKFVNVPKRAVFQVAKNDQDPFERIINQVMDKIHEGTKGLLGKFYKVPPPEKGDQQYRQWVEELYKDSVADGHRYLVTYAEHLRVYHIALTINKNTRMKNAKLHLQKYFDSLDEDRFTEIDQKLKIMFFRAMQVLSKFVQEHGEPQNPRLLRLEELLLDHHKNGATQEEKEQKEDDAKNTSKAEDLGQTEVETAPVDENQTENKEIKAGEEFQEPGDTSEEGEGEGSASEKNVAAQEEKERKEDPPDDKKSISKAEDLGQTDVETASVAGNQPKNKEIKAGEEFQEPGDTSEEGEDMGRNGGSGSEEDPFQNNQESAEETEEVNHSDVQSAGEEASTTEEEDREETSGSSTDESQETKHIANEKPGPKGILFTRTRDSTEALLDWIKETDELNIVLRPEALVGSGDGTIGMTQHEQEQVIKRFKTGEKNLLLATSVAEEGLDISDCNYVIRYDMMGNEISSVQSRGRVRADEGKYSVVVSTESGAGKRELTNRFRECLMIEALSKVQSMDPKTFIIKVRTIQRTTSQDRFLKKQVVACRKSADLPDDVNFRCRKCNNIACQASDIRRIKDNYHVVINRNFRDSEVVLEPLSKPKKIDDVLMAKKIYCHKCKEDFGVTALINSVEWMCIKVRSFVLEFSDKDPSRRMYRKWKDVPFSIREATVDELLKQATDQGGAEFDSDDFNLD